MAIVPMAARFGVGAPNLHFTVDPVWITAALLGLVPLSELRSRLPACRMGCSTPAFSSRRRCMGWAWRRVFAPDIQIAAQTLVGAWVGCRFIGFDWRLLRQLVFAAATSFLAAFAVAASFAVLASAAVGAPFADTLVAFAPGGLEAMTMMAFALELDPLFVGAHHIARFFFISVTLPWVARWIEGAVAPAARPAENYGK